MNAAVMPFDTQAEQDIEQVSNAVNALSQGIEKTVDVVANAFNTIKLQAESKLTKAEKKELIDWIAEHFDYGKTELKQLASRTDSMAKRYSRATKLSDNISFEHEVLVIQSTYDIPKTVKRIKDRFANLQELLKQSGLWSLKLKMKLDSINKSSKKILKNMRVITPHLERLLPSTELDRMPYIRAEVIEIPLDDWEHIQIDLAKDNESGVDPAVLKGFSRCLKLQA